MNLNFVSDFFIDITYYIMNKVSENIVKFKEFLKMEENFYFSHGIFSIITISVVYQIMNEMYIV